MGIKSQNGEKAEEAEIADRTQLSQNVKHQSDEPTKQEEPTQNQKVVGLGFVRTSDKSKELLHIESTWMLVLAELLIPIHNATSQRKTRQRNVRYDAVSNYLAVSSQNSFRIALNNHALA